ncbi:hypothetical protein N4S61_10795 [Burkholderia pseudomallei]|uniref:hypothetical protein n=1 Tax=Burkholderia pseudomallei TaxID=28450 RepID=UPI0021B1D0FC|nr:hypothetical protein [Burkholderia pseudomallei]MCT7346503.1 hypothetical protein [Burkholderia pseudomallei]MCT7918065.1 hypothetical protein [Burkholderia pseudomallei]
MRQHVLHQYLSTPVGMDCNFYPVSGSFDDLKRFNEEAMPYIKALVNMGRIGRLTRHEEHQTGYHFFDWVFAKRLV